MATSKATLIEGQYTKVTDGNKPVLLQSHGDEVRIAFSAGQPVASNTVYHLLAARDQMHFDYNDTAIWAMPVTSRSTLIISEGADRPTGSEVVIGVVQINQGGTGATNLVDAKLNLEIITDAERVLLNSALQPGTPPTLTTAANMLNFTDGEGGSNSIDLSLYLDDTNLARITSGVLAGTIMTFTRDDATTFSIDVSSLLDNTNDPRIISGAYAAGSITLTRNDASTIAIDVSAGTTGSVTVHSDVTSAGSGQIITNAERILLNSALQTETNTSLTYAGTTLTYDRESGVDQVIDLSTTLATTAQNALKANKAGDTITGAWLLPLGTAALPSYSFSGDTNTGVFRPSADTIGFATNGVQRASVNNTGLGVNVNASKGILHSLVGASTGISPVRSGEVVFESGSTGGIHILAGISSQIVFGGVSAGFQGLINYNNVNNTMSFSVNTAIVLELTSTQVVGRLGTAVSPSYTFTGDINTGVFSPSADAWAVSTGGVERVRIDSAGIVSIGTASTLNSDQLHMNNQTGGQSSSMRFTNASTGVTVTDGFRVGIGSTGAPFFINYEANDILFATNGGAVASLAIKPDGSLAHGASSLPFLASSGSQLNLGGVSSGGWDILTLNTNNVERVRIDSAGNVGIGTSTPLGPLHVLQTDGVSYFESSGISSVGLQFKTNNTNRFLIQTPNSSADLAFLSGGSLERMRITNAGNVGIGTATPVASAKLQVDSTTQGFLPPKMTTAQRTAIASPAAGLMVYDTTLNQMSYYNGTAWVNY